jgi:hypothetical protein
MIVEQRSFRKYTLLEEATTQVVSFFYVILSVGQLFLLKWNDVLVLSHNLETHFNNF